jgi:hypothetical protein
MIALHPHQMSLKIQALYIVSVLYIALRID